MFSRGIDDSNEGVGDHFLWRELVKSRKKTYQNVHKTEFLSVRLTR